jgi:light-regulated signal transduction histidine kinase (bacteriophytochrome)
LEAVNQELEAFSYSVSHDLRAPLRAIDGFSYAVLQLYEDQLDEQGRKYLNRIRQSSQYMARLIDDILELSRLNRAPLNIRDQVNLSEIARQIADELHQHEPQRSVKFYIQEDVVAAGDPRLLQSVLENLIGNSWKFTSKHPEAHIEFGSFQNNGKTVYFVKDDGTGFNMKYADKIFGAFQRLHRADEFPGTGVGLATAARVIRRHGGEIWAEAEIESGATFYFTLEAVSEEEIQNVREKTKKSHLAG